MNFSFQDEITIISAHIAILGNYRCKYLIIIASSKIIAKAKDYFFLLLAGYTLSF